MPSTFVQPTALAGKRNEAESYPPPELRGKESTPTPGWHPHRRRQSYGGRGDEMKRWGYPCPLQNSP